MKIPQLLGALSAFATVFGLVSVLSGAAPGKENSTPSASSNSAVGERAQVPTWSPQDLDFFLHGSMSTEFVPENVLRAFMRTYPDLFPGGGLGNGNFGLLPDQKFGWPIGFSRKKVPHLGGLPAVGLNCAACHVGDVYSASDGALVRVLGMTSHFDAEAFIGAVIISTFRTADLANMKKFLAAYLAVNDSLGGEQTEELFDKQWREQDEKIRSAIAENASKNTGGLRPIDENELRLDAKRLVRGGDLAGLTASMLTLFHNMRAALHVPDQPPDKAPPPSGPGRNDAFGLLSAALFGAPQPPAPVKYGLVWNVEDRKWVHWDGNTRSPLGRNLLASLGLGAPLNGKQGELDFALVKRQTDLSERIRAPRYPFTIDEAAAKRGIMHYQARCASCHGGQESDKRLYTTAEIGTDPARAELFNQLQADRFNKFLAELETPGYQPSKEPGLRSTQKYWAASLAGVWARSPYLHNGSVRTMQELLTPPAARAKFFHRGSIVYDTVRMGYTDVGSYVLDTAGAGNANTGHDYGTELSSEQKRELIEYLKTL